MSDTDTLVDSWKPDFQRAHDADPRNARRQSFEDYWSWVRVFLVTGGAGQRGWLDLSDEVAGRVGDAAASGDLRERLRGLGRTIAAEWAKDSRARRIHSTLLQGSPNLMDWSRRLQRAAAGDAGDGVSINRAIDAIERDLRAAVPE